MFNVPAILLTGVFYTISKCIVDVIDTQREIKRIDEEKTKIIGEHFLLTNYFSS